jgi:hypothetical protein
MVNSEICHKGTAKMNGADGGYSPVGTIGRAGFCLEEVAKESKSVWSYLLLDLLEVVLACHIQAS